MLERFTTEVEAFVLGGQTWATREMSFPERLKFYRYTGEWPGLYSKETTRLFMQGSIEAERVAGKHFCAGIKLKRAKEAGLMVK